jgi:hypothetical protein
VVDLLDIRPSASAVKPPPEPSPEEREEAWETIRQAVEAWVEPFLNPPIRRPLLKLPDDWRHHQPKRKKQLRPRHEKVGPQMRRVLPVLKKLYPPDGKASDDIATEFVRGQVNKELELDTRNKGLADVSWDTVNRALGRG